MQTKEEKQKDLESRVKEVLSFAKEKEIFIGAVQQLNRETGYIEIIPLYRDMRQDISEEEATPSPEEFLPDTNA